MEGGGHPDASGSLYGTRLAFSAAWVQRYGARLGQGGINCSSSIRDRSWYQTWRQHLIALGIRYRYYPSPMRSDTRMGDGHKFRGRFVYHPIWHALWSTLNCPSDIQHTTSYNNRRGILLILASGPGTSRACAVTSIETCRVKHQH